MTALRRSSPEGSASSRSASPPAWAACSAWLGGAPRSSPAIVSAGPRAGERHAPDAVIHLGQLVCRLEDLRPGSGHLVEPGQELEVAAGARERRAGRRAHGVQDRGVFRERRVVDERSHASAIAVDDRRDGATPFTGRQRHGPSVRVHERLVVRQPEAQLERGVAERARQRFTEVSRREPRLDAHQEARGRGAASCRPTSPLCPLPSDRVVVGDGSLHARPARLTEADEEPSAADDTAPGRAVPGADPRAPPGRS